jgi:hypothetical protein
VLRKALRRNRAATIHLVRPKPGAPSDAGRIIAPYLVLLRTGFTLPPRSPDGAVGSYPTISPLPSFAKASEGGILSVALAFPRRMVRGIPLCNGTSCPAESGLSSPRNAERPPDIDDHASILYTERRWVAPGSRGDAPGRETLVTVSYRSKCPPRRPESGVRSRRNNNALHLGTNRHRWNLIRGMLS